MAKGNDPTAAAAAAERDKALIQAFYDGDDAAFEKLVRLHHAHLVRLLNCMGAWQDGSAEDLVWETWAKVASTKNNPNSQYCAARGTPFTAWLNKIAENRWKSHWQRQAKIPRTVPVEEIQERLAGTEPDPAAILHSEVLAAVWKLEEPPYRSVLVMHLLEGLTFREIGEVHGHDTKWASQKYYTARDRVRSDLQQRGLWKEGVTRGRRS